MVLNSSRSTLREAKYAGWPTFGMGSQCCRSLAISASCGSVYGPWRWDWQCDCCNGGEGEPAHHETLNKDLFPHDKQAHSLTQASTTITNQHSEAAGLVKRSYANNNSSCCRG